jgi:hypothetical protein
VFGLSNRGPTELAFRQGRALHAGRYAEVLTF